MGVTGNLLSNDLLFCGIGVVAGVVAHRGLFIHGEWHLQAPNILVFHVLLFTILLSVRSHYGDSVAGKAFNSLVLMSYCYVSALEISIVTYRAFFHPLTKAGFQGPWYARMTKLWHLWACRKSQNHLVMARMHEKYGDFVRTGPSEIAVFHPDVFMAVNGPRAECIKSDWYDLIYPKPSLVTMRDKTVHGARRRKWNQGFTTQVLAQHIAKIIKHVEKLDQRIEEDARANKPSELRDLFYWFGFDAMGDFVFNKSFNMLREKKWHHIVVSLQNALSLLGPLTPAPWLIQIGFRLLPPVWALRDWFQMRAWCKNVMRARLVDGQTKQVDPDLTHYLMEQGDHSIDDESLDWLDGDSLVAIVAGSEPTAATLIFLFSELARHPEHAEKINGELEDVDVNDPKALARCEHLNAVLNETMRLYPAILTSGTRVTTDHPVLIGDTLIPPHTTILTPRIIISQREDCFQQPHDFVPERWTTRPEMILNATAFSPFGVGHYSCLGRFLAVDMMRCVTARFVKKYRFGFAPGETGERVFGDVKDQFTTNPGRLVLSFELRCP